MTKISHLNEGDYIFAYLSTTLGESGEINYMPIPCFARVTCVWPTHNGINAEIIKVKPKGQWADATHEFILNTQHMGRKLYPKNLIKKANLIQAVRMLKYHES